MFSFIRILIQGFPRNIVYIPFRNIIHCVYESHFLEPLMTKLEPSSKIGMCCATIGTAPLRTKQKSLSINRADDGPGEKASGDIMFFDSL